MTYYPDGAPCDYYGGEYASVFVAIGWLAATRDYPRGRLPAREYKCLLSLHQQPYRLMFTLGRYECELCGDYLSTGDLFVPHGSDVFVAPGGILHYVQTHDYLPPAEFRRAILECPPMGSAKYFAALLRTDWAPIAREWARKQGLNLEDELDRDLRWNLEHGADGSPPSSSPAIGP